MKEHYIQSLRMKNFMAFDKIELSNFSPGINILIGPNGTGKTQILKILYCLAWTESKEHDSETENPKNVLVAPKAEEIFKPLGLGHLVRWRNPNGCEVDALFSKKEQSILLRIWPGKTGDLYKVQEQITVRTKKLLRNNIVYIPSKEILSNAPGFVSEIEKRYLEFEGIYRDIIVNAYTPPLKFKGSEPFYHLLDRIKGIIGGEVIEEGGRFYLKMDTYKLEFMLVAEGYSKFGLLWRLINNGSIEPGSTIFWDEPESGISPNRFKDLVEIILTLQRHEVQLFVTTHNYAFLKYFDLLIEDSNNIKYYSLYKNKEDTICVNSTTDYLSIEPNAIIGTYLDLYEIELKKNLSEGE